MRCEDKHAHLAKIAFLLYFFKVKKKILFIITQSEFGGAQRFLSTLIPHLNQDEYEVLVATGSTGDEHFTEHLNNLNIPNTRLHHLVRNPRPWHDVLAIFEIRKLIKSFQPSTLFLLSSKAGFLGSLASFVIRPRVIYRIGGWAFNDPQSWLRRRLIIAAERFSARWKDVIIVNNRHDFDQARQLGIRPRTKVVLIYNGLDAANLKLYTREEARAKLGLDQNIFVAGTIARNYPSKGLQYLPRDPAGYRHVVLSNVKHASRYLKAFDVYVSPSVKEGFSWAVLEAMAAGVPVIATSVGAAPEMIKDGRNGFLVKPRRADQIAGRIVQLMKDEQLRQEFSVRGHQTVLERFNLTAMVQEIEKTLRESW